MYIIYQIWPSPCSGTGAVLYGSRECYPQLSCPRQEALYRGFTRAEPEDTYSRLGRLPDSRSRNVAFFAIMGARHKNEGFPRTWVSQQTQTLHLCLRGVQRVPEAVYMLSSLGALPQSRYKLLVPTEISRQPRNRVSCWKLGRVCHCCLGVRPRPCLMLTLTNAWAAPGLSLNQPCCSRGTARLTAGPVLLPQLTICLCQLMDTHTASKKRQAKLG
jgi:hypothetical protein